MIVNYDCDIESLFRATPLEMLSDLLLSVQQLSYEGGIKVVVESVVSPWSCNFLTYSLRGSRPSSTVAEGLNQ